jgi:glycosyltransferase involved in cell wall biosynthesis
MDTARDPVVSIIVRSMDRAALARALASIAAQDARAPSAEVLVIAACGAAHRPVPGSIGRFEARLVASASRLARPAAANAGLDAARGRCITFLDDDDELLPDQLAALAGELDADPAADLVHARSIAVDAEGRQLYVYGGPWIAHRQLSHGFFQLGAVMFRREVLARGVRFDESLEILEDLEFFVQCAQVARFRYLEKPVSLYHVTEGDSGTGAGANRDPERLRRALGRIRTKWSDLAHELEASTPARLERARDAILRHDYAFAVATLAPLVESARPDVNALNLSGVARIQLGELDRARELLDRALAILPGNPGLLENVRLLERKRAARASTPQ